MSAAAALALLAGVASAQPVKSLHVDSVQAFTGGQVVRGLGDFSTGFETAESYVVGPISGQNGWTASVNANQNAFNVNTANPFAGSQHLRIGFDDAVAAGSQRVILGPSLGTLPAGPSTTSVMVNISNDGGSDYDVIGQAPSQSLLSWRVKFRWQGATAGSPGTIFVLDDTDLATPGAQLGFVNTNVAWNEGVYTELRVEFGTSTIDYYYGGALIHSSAGGIIAGTSVEQFVVVTDNFQLDNEFADFDNVSIIPAPGALALLGLGVAGAARRRRHA